MARPLYWFRNPKRLDDETLIERLTHLLVQLANRSHQEDPEARVWLEATLRVHLDEVDRRIAQGKLFD